jgi:hypothetical protein
MPESTKVEAPKPAVEKKNEKEDDKSEMVTCSIIFTHSLLLRYSILFTINAL